MRIILLLFAVCVIGAQSVWGQLTIRLSLDQNVYLSGEAVVAHVEISNLSGQTISLGSSSDWLRFSVESHDGTFVNRLGDIDMSGTFDLASSVAASRGVNILPAFDMLRSGRYKVTATAKVEDWGQFYNSNSVTLDVVKGVEVVKFDVGVPKLDGDPQKEMPEVRRYSLIRVAYLDKMRLYVRITDAASNTIYQVTPICGMVAFSDPKAMIDSRSCLHVLNQIHARRFIYFVTDTSGNMLKRELYDYIGSKPVLYQNTDSSVNVRGGVRMRTSADFPPSPTPELPPSIVTKPGDSITNAVPDLKNMTKEEQKRYKEEQKRLKEEKKRLEREEKARKKASKDW